MSLTSYEKQAIQRKSLVKSTGQYGRKRNELDRMLGESLSPQNWEYLSNRDNPLPADISPKRALYALGNVLAGLIEIRDEQSQNTLW